MGDADPLPDAAPGANSTAEGIPVPATWPEATGETESAALSSVTKDIGKNPKKHQKTH
jgi:hypothetical protein